MENLASIIKQVKDKTTGIPLDAIPFHPYYTVKDLIGLTVFLIVFTSIIFFAPEMGGYFLEHNNFVPVRSLSFFLVCLTLDFAYAVSGTSGEFSFTISSLAP